MATGLEIDLGIAGAASLFAIDPEFGGRVGAEDEAGWAGIADIDFGSGIHGEAAGPGLGLGDGLDKGTGDGSADEGEGVDPAFVGPGRGNGPGFLTVLGVGMDGLGEAPASGDAAPAGVVIAGFAES